MTDPAVLADDDADDRELAREALQESRLLNTLRYELGASSFITKPVTFPALVEVMNGIGRDWFELVELPT